MTVFAFFLVRVVGVGASELASGGGSHRELGDRLSCADAGGSGGWLSAAWEWVLMGLQFIVLKIRLIEAKGRKAVVGGQVEDTRGTVLAEATYVPHSLLPTVAV